MTRFEYACLREERPDLRFKKQTVINRRQKGILVKLLQGEDEPAVPSFVVNPAFNKVYPDLRKSWPP